MPLNDYLCSCGVMTEALRPAGTATVDCPCGRPARRIPPRRFGIVGPTTDLRGMFRRFQEASQERDAAYGKAEADLERPIQAPSLWQRAKQQAQAMTAAGEVPTLKT